MREKINYNKRLSKLRKPLKIIILYYFFTIILYAFGPHKWTNENNLFLYTILFLYSISFIFGYEYEIRKRTNTVIHQKISASNEKSLRFVKNIMILTTLITIISTSVYSKISFLSLNEIINQIIHSFINPKEAYESSFEGFSSGYIYTVFVLTGPITWLAFPLSVLYFQNFNIKYKAITIILYIAEALRWITMGRNKGVFDLIIVIIVIGFVKRVYKSYNNYPIHNSLKRRINKNTLISIFLIVVALIYFTNTVGSRMEPYFYLDQYSDSPLMSICPEIFQPTLVYITSYTSQGYRALSKLIDLDWTPMFGIGNSMFLISNFEDFFNEDFFKYTYQAKLSSYGIDSKSAWHSFYTWFANDVHWIGVIFIMIFLGRLFGYTYKKCITEGELVSFSILVLIFIMLIYIPGNNQILNEGLTFMAFWGLLIYWIIIKSNLFRKTQRMFYWP